MYLLRFLLSRILLRGGRREMFIRHYAILMGPDLPVTFDGCRAQIFVKQIKRRKLPRE
jgi:hypothetical protein